MAGNSCVAGSDLSSGVLGFQGLTGLEKVILDIRKESSTCIACGMTVMIAVPKAGRQRRKRLKFWLQARRTPPFYTRPHCPAPGSFCYKLKGSISQAKESHSEQPTMAATMQRLTLRPPLSRAACKAGSAHSTSAAAALSSPLPRPPPVKKLEHIIRKHRPLTRDYCRRRRYIPTNRTCCPASLAFCSTLGQAFILSNPKFSVHVTSLQHVRPSPPTSASLF